MNDRFKFRVWDKQDECYAYSNNSDVDVLYIETDGELTYGVYSNYYEDMSYIPEREVIVEQCTGLKDKNGKLIYEGDILKIVDQCIEYIVSVYWESGMYCFAITPNSANLVFSDLSDNETTCEIIGNIHENADLIKVGGK